MAADTKIVISASRRTDIPAFYMPWFMEQVERGYFTVTNPFNGKVSVVTATPERVHTFGFWSKDFGSFLESRFGERLREMGYHLFFNFTLNSAVPLLEPRVPALEARLTQLEDLCRRFGAVAVNWRFDPICFFTDEREGICNNLADFSRIAAVAAACGVERCITSFMDDYAKIRRRTAAIPGFQFLYPGMEDRRQIVLEMAGALSEKNMALHLCCEKDLLDSLSEGSGIKGSSCIPNELLMRLYGGSLSLKRDGGQRVAAGCGCRVSVDIGSYGSQPCHHRCLFCYANPALA